MNRAFPQEALKHVADVRFSNVDKKKHDDELPVLLCNYTDVYYNDTITNDIDFMEATATPAEIARFRLQPGDILLTKDSESADDIGVPAFVDASATHAVCGYHLAQVRPTAIHPRFLFYALKADPAGGFFEVSARGVTRFGLTQDAVRSVKVPRPAIDEQRRIADFLDTETARIDALVEAKTRLAELLRAKRSAGVSSLLSHGLDASVEMKDSGVPWIGQVPRHWQVRRLKSFAASTNSGVWGEDADDCEHPVPVARTGDLTMDGDIDVVAMERRCLTPDEARKYECRRGDIIVVKSSGSATSIISGKCGLIGEAEDGIAFSNFMMRLRPDARTIEPEFLFLFLTSYEVRERIRLMVSTTTYPNLRIPEYLGFEVALPPLNEQQEIVEVAKRRNRSLRDAEAMIGEQLLRLAEYRQALITAAVTGQLGDATLNGSRPVVDDVSVEVPVE